MRNPISETAQKKLAELKKFLKKEVKPIAQELGQNSEELN